MRQFFIIPFACSLLLPVFSPAVLAADTREFNRLWDEGSPLDSCYPANKNEGNF